MVERYRRGKGKKKLLGSHQRCWLWGRNVVFETLKAGKWIPFELHLAADRLDTAQLDEMRSWAERRRVPVYVETAEVLTRLCRSSEHQGYLAKMPPFPEDSAADLLQHAPPAPLYVLLDSIQDPYNFGAIVRSADVLGIDAIFMAEQGQVGVTSLVARASAGAVNHVPLARVPDLVEFVRTLRGRNLQVVAATEKADRPLFACDFRSPTVVIIGNEGTGIQPALLELSDIQIQIPQLGNVGSLNAAVSAGILFYEARRQRSADVWQKG